MIIILFLSTVIAFVLYVYYITSQPITLLYNILLFASARVFLFPAERDNNKDNTNK